MDINFYSYSDIQSCLLHGSLRVQNNFNYPIECVRKKISALRGNSSREIVFGGPFICVLDILVGLFTHITCFGLLYFDILFQTIKTFLCFSSLQNCQMFSNRRKIYSQYSCNFRVSNYNLFYLCYLFILLLVVKSHILLNYLV